jgi:hypothetical protein
MGGFPVRVTIALAALSLVLACVPIHRVSTGGIVPGQSVSHQGKVLLLPIPDGVEREEGPAIGSGNLVYSSVRDTLIGKGIAVITTDKTEMSSAFTEAAELGCEYLLKGAIPEWEDNATEWSGRPDVAALSLELYNARERTLVASATHRVASSTAQMFSRKPDRFVPELVDHTLGKIFGWAPTVVTAK